MPTRGRRCRLGAFLLVALIALTSAPAGASHSPSHYSVRKEGTSYVAESQTKRYTGALKTVVESAVSDLDSAGGGTVTFQAGVFDLGSDYFRLQEVANITFEGQGIDVTVIKNSSTASADTEPFNFSGADRVVIRDLTVTAGGSVRTTSDAIDFDRGNDSLVERVKISYSRGKGIIFDGKNAGWTSAGNTVRDCIIEGTSNDGIQFLASSNNRVESCTITNVVGDGIESTKSSTQADQPNKKSNDNVIIGNVVDNVGENGIRVNSSDRNQISGNTVRNSSDDVSGRDGIRITSADSIRCDDNIVEGNTATDTQATKTQVYGLNITSSLCNRTVVGTNDFTGNKTGAIKDSGTNTQYGTSDTQAPSTPGNLTATAVSSSRVDLSWQASTDNVGVTGYEILRNSALLASVGTVTSYSDTTVAPSTTYSYQVRARDAAGNRSGFSNTATVTTPAGSDTQSPTTPTNLTATAVSSSRVDLSWQASTDNVGVTGYEIFRNSALLASVGTVTSYSDTTVAPSTTYSYQVRARDAAGNRSGFSNTATVTTPSGSILTFGPTDDATVRANQPTSNFGSADRLEVDNSPVEHFLLKFDVSGTGNRSVVSAKLRLSCVDSSDQGGSFYRVLDPNSWSEGTVNWNTSPTADTTALASLASVSAGKVYEVDVTSLVKNRASAFVSFRVTSPSSNGADYSSKEGAVAPQLVVTTGEPDTEPPNPPSNLTATAVSSNRVDLSWTASSSSDVVGYEIFRDGVFLAEVGTVTTYSDTTVAPLTTYQYQVRARDGAGNTSSFSNTATVTTLAAPDTQPPTTPTNLTATAVSPTRVDLSWTASTDNVGVTGYEIFRDGALLDSVGEVTTYSDTTASPSTTYSYQVRARDAAGNRSALSDPATVTTPAPPDTSPPTAPANLTATAMSANRVDLSWTASTDNVGVTGYDIFRDGAPLASIGTATTHSDTTVAPSTTYQYQVRARDGAGNVSSLSNTATVTTPAAADTQPPTTPTNLTATAASPNQVDLSWTASTDNVGVTGYEVFRDGAPLASVGAVTSYSDTTVASSTSYSYQVRARDAAGNRSALSGPATVTTPAPDTEPPTAPQNLTATAESGNRVELSWRASTDNVGVTGYEIFRDGAFLAEVGTVTTYSDTTVSPLTIYQYEVRARDGAGNTSEFSNTAIVLTPLTSDTEPPNPPSNLTATAVSSNRVDLTWDASTSSDVTGYEVFRDEAFLAEVGEVTTYSDTTVSPSTTYTYQVRARDGAGNVSSFSNTATVTTPAPPDTQPPSTPTSLSVTAVSPNQVDLSWSASTDNVDVTGYEVFRDGAPLASVGAVTSYSDTTVASSTSYSYQVRARDAAGNRSALSNPATVSTPGLSVFTDGFESGNFSNWTSNAGLVAQQQEVYTGSWAARGTTTSAATWAYKTLGATYSELYYRIRFKVLSQGSSSNSTMYMLKFRTATGTSLLGLFRSPTGRLGYRNDVAGAATTSSTTIATGVWHEVQVRVRVNGASGETETWLDGVRVAALSKTENFGTTPIGRIQLGENSTGRTYDVAFDDVVANTSLIGP